jgi:hypothetical protein
MLMRHITIFILIISFCSQLLGQTGKKAAGKAPWEDTTLIIVRLNQIAFPSKVVCIDIGKKATIFLSLPDVLKAVKKPETDNIKAIKKYLDSAKQMGDTIFIADLMDFDYILSEQLQKGNAKVFYKKENVFVENISHRLEKYGMYAHRFFYLPDNRPFFSTMEYSGILEKGKYFSDPNELGKLYEKLSSERKE